MLTSLGILDQLVLIVAVGSAIAIGLAMRGRSSSLEAFLLGDRNLPWWAILGSIVATETSTATVLSVPGLGYGPTGLRFLQLAMGYILGRAIVVGILLPLYFRGSLFSAYQILGDRFGEATKRTGSAIFLVARNLGDGLRLYLAAVVLQQLAGLPLAASAIAVGGVTILYTYFGGMRSVVWNDCIQFVIYMAGGIASVFIIASAIPGGWAAYWEFSAQHNKFQVFDFDFAQNYNFWGSLVGGAVLTIGTHGTDQMMVQRYLSARSQRDAGKALLASGVVVLLQFALFLFIGTELAAYYSHFPQGVPEKPDQIFAHFIINEFPKNTGLVGLMLAAVLAAAMSTLSSSLNSSASALMNDFLLPIQTLRKEKSSPVNNFRLTRFFVAVFGVVQIVIGILAASMGDAVVNNALRIAGISSGLILGLFLLGIFSTRTSQRAALIGSCCSFCILMYSEFGLRWLGTTPIGVPWLALVGAGSTFVVGWLASVFTD